MKIALAHFRVGETDGVSLEMEKWKLIFERMGHEVIFLAGSQGTTSANTYIIDELHYKHPKNDQIVANAYDQMTDYPTEAAFKEDVMAFAQTIEDKLLHFIESENIDLVIPNNIWSLGWGLPAGIAFTNAARKSDIQFLSHHHDFSWERDRYSNPTCSCVQEWLLEYFPPNLPNVRHVVINHIAKGELQERRGIEATVVPNVFDFNAPVWSEDEYNRDFRKAVGVGEDDLVILQATRIAERKAIELGIEFVAELQNNQLEKLNGTKLYNGKTFDSEKNNIVYLFAGLPEASSTYLDQLKNKADELGVDVRFVNEKIEHSRKLQDEEKIYSLWDAYVFADFVTYPSILEGWGNQLLEAVFAKKAMVVYEYPVYGTDIKDKDFTFMSLGDTHTVLADGLVKVEEAKIKAAAGQAANVLTDAQLYTAMTNKNFEIANDYYSYEALYQYLIQLVEPAKVNH